MSHSLSHFFQTLPGQPICELRASVHRQLARCLQEHGCYGNDLDDEGQPRWMTLTEQCHDLDVTVRERREIGKGLKQLGDGV